MNNLEHSPITGLTNISGSRFGSSHTAGSISQLGLANKQSAIDKTDHVCITCLSIDDDITASSIKINIEFFGGTKHIDYALQNGELLRAYLDVNLHLQRLNSYAQLFIDENCERIVTSTRQQLPNVLAFLENAFKIPTYEQITLDDRGKGLFPQLSVKAIDSNEGLSTLSYWRRIREALREMFSLKLEVLADAIGVSYATFANLGKMRPKEKTVAKVLRLHELARAVKAADPVDGANWLCGAGAALLREQGLEAFSDAVDALVFGSYELPQAKIRIEDEPASEVTFSTTLRRPPKGGERF